MLLSDVEVEGRRCDVRITGGTIAAMTPSLPPLPGETVLAAGGGALLPGLHDHHIHLNAMAAALASVRCGPPDVTDGPALAAALAAAPGTGWLRGVGYHDSVAGEIDRHWLDAHGPDRPVRIQHRGGRLWIFNSLALEQLGPGLPADGRLIDGDRLLRGRMAGAPPDLAPVGARLLACGVTGVTEVTPHKMRPDYERLAAAGLPQHLLVMGGPDLDDAPSRGRTWRGGVKLHYHDHDLPALDDLIGEVARAHAAGRIVASHCVTRAELLLTLAAIEAAGPMAGDRIEHAAIVTPDAAAWMADLGLVAVSQPHFLVERGAAYRTEVEADDRPWLYRLQGLVSAGIGLAAGSDAPFGSSDPWRAMAAAVNRPDGFGAGEELAPEQALGLFLGPLEAPAGAPRRVAVGAAADLCLIDRPWSHARLDLAAVRVRATLVDGQAAYLDSSLSTNPQASAC